MQLFQGDCLDLLDQVADNSVHLALLDLPYLKTKNTWEKPVDLTRLWLQLKRVMIKRGAVLHFGIYPFTVDLINSNRKGYRHTWTWDKGQAGNFAGAKFGPLNVTEDILVFNAGGSSGVNYYPQMRTGRLRTKGGKASLKNGKNYGGMKNIHYESSEYYPTSILKFAGVPREERLHESQKPLDLLRYFIKTYSQAGETVLDCTMGSGSTIVAAVGLGREAIGMELVPEIYQVAVNRLQYIEVLPADQPAEKQLTLFA